MKGLGRRKVHRMRRMIRNIVSEGLGGTEVIVNGAKENMEQHL